MTDTRVDSVETGRGTVRQLQARSYYDKELKQHFALIPPGDDKLSRIAIPCSVLDLDEQQFCALLSIYSAVQSAGWRGLNSTGTVVDWMKDDYGKNHRTLAKTS